MTHPNGLPSANDLLQIERRAQAMRAQVLAQYFAAFARGLSALPNRISHALRRTAHS